MRVETKTVTYYTLAELKEHHPNGFERALDMLRQSLWDGGHAREDVADTMAYEFGRRVGDMTVERFGEGDYPGVAGVELIGWDLQRGSYVAFKGTLEPEHTPGLPWGEDGWLESVRLTGHRHGTEIEPVVSYEAPDPLPLFHTKGRELTENQIKLIALVAEMKDAVQEALGEALSAGQNQAEAIETEEYLLETAEANEWEFDQTGAWA